MSTVKINALITIMTTCHFHMLFYQNICHFKLCFHFQTFFRRQTILVKLDTQGESALQYSPGDHVAILPENSSELVDTIVIRLHNAPPPDQLIRIEILSERTTLLGKKLELNKAIDLITPSFAKSDY